jgi:hypothetical protein
MELRQRVFWMPLQILSLYWTFSIVLAMPYPIDGLEGSQTIILTSNET